MSNVLFRIIDSRYEKQGVLDYKKTRKNVESMLNIQRLRKCFFIKRKTNCFEVDTILPFKTKQTKNITKMKKAKTDGPFPEPFLIPGD